MDRQQRVGGGIAGQWGRGAMAMATGGECDQAGDEKDARAMASRPDERHVATPSTRPHEGERRGRIGDLHVSACDAQRHRRSKTMIECVRGHRSRANDG